MKLGMVVSINNKIGIVTRVDTSSRMCYTILLDDGGYVHCGRDIKFDEVLR